LGKKATMTTELSLDKTFLTETLQREYGLSIELIESLPTGWMAYCYRVTCTGGERYFLKLQGVDWTASFTHDPAFCLPLTHALHAQGILPHIVYPIPTKDGRLMLEKGGFHWVLSNYIAGRTVGFGKITPGLLARLAGLVGILHRSAPLISLAHPLREQYALAFETDLLRSFDILQNLTADDRQGKRALRDLLLPRRDEILGLLRRLKAFQAQVMTANKAQVLCHADLHGGNLMLDDQDNLYSNRSGGRTLTIFHGEQ
jgi:spectinomycin phosphotransferase